MRLSTDSASGFQARPLAALAAVLVASLLLVHGAPARAGSDAASRESKAHFGSALKWYNIEKYEAALEEFEAAYLAKSDPVYLFNIGQCYRFL